MAGNGDDGPVSTAQSPPVLGSSRADQSQRLGRRSAPAVLERVAPYPMLVVSLIASFGASTWDTDQWRPTSTALVVVLAAAAALHRWWGDHRPTKGPAWLACHWVLSSVLVVLAPFFCIYAFCGYFDVHRRLPRRVRTPAMVPFAAIIALGQSGGTAGLVASPWLFLLLFAVNASLGPVMAHVVDQREVAISLREDAVRRLEAEQRRSAALQAQLIEQAREAGVIEERDRLSREIHDTVAQGLIAIITQLESINPDDPPQAWQARVGTAGSVARESLAEARRAIHALASPLLDAEDLPAALERAVQRWADANRISVTLHTDGQPRRTGHEETLLRVAQEAMANIARHSGAGHAAFTLTYSPHEVRLDVRDDGCGFDPSDTAPSAGLSGMRARIAAAGGTVDLETARGDGCTVSVAVPA